MVQSWLPRMGPTKLLIVLPGPWPAVVAAVAGAAAGFVVGAIASHEDLSVTR
ncbi:YqeB family protein [Actinomadura coerulea]|uniref:YqeB family protein n=1 Tax=Actinomadura coerulea TaxID=46159 RepID=UPI00342325A3